MKRILPKILILTIAVLLVVSLVACNKNRNNHGTDGPNEYETATYNVTFDSNGSTSFAKYNLTGVEFGTYISAPNENGILSIPTKTGYSFSYWSADGHDAFDFETTPVTSDLTLTAVYLPITYVHNACATARLVQSTDGSGNVTYSVEKNTYAGGALGNEDVVQSIYNYTSTDLPIPTTTVPGDRFMFWYYLDADGKPQEFSTTATLVQSATTRVSELSAYNAQNFPWVSFTRIEDDHYVGLDLYAMWYSELPQITVVYKDSLSDATYGSFDYYQTDYAVEAQAPDMREAKTGYIFDKWYYVVTDAEGNERSYDFKFDDADDDDDNPTTLATAAGIESVFESGTLNLYARWKKILSVASKDDYDAIYNVMHGDSSEEDKENVLKSTIYIAGDVDLGTSEYAPLFDAEHKFVGDIDGGLKDANGVVIGNAKLIGGVFGDGTNASIFGYVDGNIKNIDFENVGLKFAIPEVDGTTFVAGVVATSFKGVMDNVNVTIASLTADVAGSAEEGGHLTNGLAAVTFGGIVGVNGGEIKNVSVDISLSSLSESIVLGGVAGKNTSKITDADVNLTLTSVKCLDNNKGADGVCYVQIGGVVGSNSGTVEGITAAVVVTSVSGERLDFGGIAASNLGTLSKISADVNLTAAAKSYANVGGLAGKSDGEIKNCLANAELTVNYSGIGMIIAGGLVGNNGATNVGNLSYSYAVGSITLSSENSANVYVGGVVGKNTNRSKISAYFSAVDISVQNGGTNSVGALFGDDNNVTSISVGWYADDVDVRVGGVAVDNLGMGNAVARANLKDATYVIGASSTIKFDGTIWQIEGDNYPSLK